MKIHFILSVLAAIAYSEPVNIDPNFVCPSNGLYANPKNCDEFYQCNEKKAFIKKCPKGLKFDDWWKVCNWESANRCGPLPDDYQGPTTTVLPTLEPPPCQKEGPGFVSCSSLQQCILAKKLCDGVEDCDDKSDEVYCPHIKNEKSAADCDSVSCKLPLCYCNKAFSTIPGNLKKENVPQMILISTSGSINEQKYDKIKTLFKNSYTNPNGCPIKGTHFISHPYTNYYLVQTLYSEGHEIAIESTSQSVPQMWWQTATTEEWQAEVDSENHILQRFSQLGPDDIRGARAPFFQAGGDNQFQAFANSGFTYDASLLTPYFEDPSWPFTLDYKMPFSCSVYKCPNHSYKGLWEVPLNNLYGHLKRPCVVLDQCFNENDENKAYLFLLENFQRHYHSNKGPLNLVLGDHWLNTTGNLFKALSRFIEETTSNKYNDVWFVTYSQLIHWMKSIHLNDAVKSKQSFQCPKSVKPICSQPNVCSLKFGDELRSVTTCSECPSTYPWKNNY